MASFTAERFLVLCMFISLVLAAPLPVSRDQQQDRSNRSIRNLHARQYDDDGDWNPTATTTTAEDEPTDSAPWLWAVTTTASTTTTTTTQWQQPTASASPHNGRHGNHEEEEDNDDDEEKDYQEEEDDDSTTQAIATPTTTSSSSSKSTTMAAASSKKSKGGSGGGSFSGKATWYTVGMGSCGSENSDSELVAAMNHGQMANGGNSNNNPNCGRRVNIHGPNGSVTVKVVDTCPSCGHGDIDLSPSAFKRIANLDDGVVSIKWSW